MDLQHPKYSLWYKSLVNNDTLSASICLSQATEDEKHILLNGEFKFTSDDGAKIARLDGCRNVKLRKPLCLAAAFGATAMIDLLLDSKTDLYSTDIGQHNVIHALITMAAHFSEREQRMVEVYEHLQRTLTGDQLRRLLHMEDEYNLRPLELASKCSTFRLMMAIFETPDVYLTKVITEHTTTYKYYDVTEYEGGELERYKQSPIGYFIIMDERCLGDEFTVSLFKPGSIIHQWISNKFVTNLYFLRIWFLARMTFFIGYLIYDSDEHWVSHLKGSSSNSSILTTTNSSAETTIGYCPEFTPIHMSSYTRNVMMILFTCYWAVANAVDVYDFFNLCFHLKFFTGYVGSSRRWGRNFVHRNLWYRLTNIITVNLIQVNLVFQRRLIHTQDWAREGLRIATICFGVWSPLFFMQALPKIGYLVVIVQRMIGDIFLFSVMFALIVLPFSQTLLMFMNVNSKQGCIEEFSSFSESFYSVLRMMQNMLDLSEFHVEHKMAITIIHIALIFFISILIF